MRALLLVCCCEYFKYRRALALISLYEQLWCTFMQCSKRVHRMQHEYRTAPFIYYFFCWIVSWKKSVLIVIISNKSILKNSVLWAIIISRLLRYSLVLWRLEATKFQQCNHIIVWKQYALFFLLFETAYWESLIRLERNSRKV